MRDAHRVPHESHPQKYRRIFLFASLALCAICTSCGGSTASGPPPPVTVSVMPNSAKPYQGESVQFNAVVENAATSVTWQVSQVPSGNSPVGTIDSTGLYTAPASVPTQPTVTVIAVLQSDPTKTGSASVTILSLSSIQGPLTLSPALSSVTTSQSVQLNVLTAGVSNSDVNWAVDGVANGSAVLGTISAAGDYTPSPTARSHLITATLQANPGAIGTATVEVTDFPGTLTWRNDNARSGVNHQELALAPATVSPSTFGKLFSCPIDGYAYAQPLYVPNLAISGNGTHNVVFVATEKDSVFAFDADGPSCVPLWKASLIPTGTQAISNANMNIVPFVGITGTPVIEASASALYAVAATQTAALNPTYNHWLYALDLATGTKLQPAGIASPDSVFDSSLETQRPALLLDHGIVYIAFGSNGLAGDDHGWLFGYDSSARKQTGVFNVTQLPNTQGGIWQSGGGPSADANGNVFVVTGNGPFNVNITLGSYSYGNSFLRFSLGGWSPADYFTPCNQATLQTGGLDVGASAPVLGMNSLSQPILIGGSKNGSLYVVNPNNMGGFVGTCPDSPSRVQTVSVGSGPILSTPLFWDNAVYVAPGNANGNGYLQSFPMSTGTLASTPSASQSPETLGPQGATPVISWNGSTTGTSNAILWLIDTSGALATPNTAAILRAYDPNNLSNEIYNSSAAASLRDQAGPAVKFTVPTVANGKVYVGTQTELDVYGLLP
jgi:hypothetical protein